MSSIVSWSIAICIVTTFASNYAFSHSGRRFEVRADSGKLTAQGVNNGPYDGAPNERPYFNVIHDHWQNSPLGLDTAFATLPGFDMPSPSPGLIGQPVYLRLDRVLKWSEPPVMSMSGAIPFLEPLASDELVTLSIRGETINSSALGQLLLVPSVSEFGNLDIDLLYEANFTPSSEIVVLATTLVSASPAVEESNSVYILLSPDGDSPDETLHHASLFLERSIDAALTVPEPAASTFLMFWLAVVSTHFRSFRNIHRERAKR